MHIIRTNTIQTATLTSNPSLSLSFFLSHTRIHWHILTFPPPLSPAVHAFSPLHPSHAQREEIYERLINHPDVIWAIGHIVHAYKRPTYSPKETYILSKRDQYKKEANTHFKRYLFTLHKRPTYAAKETYKHADSSTTPTSSIGHSRSLRTAKETHAHSERDLYTLQKRPINIHARKETNAHWKRDQHTLQKKPIHTAKETNTQKTCSRWTHRITNIGHSILTWKRPKQTAKETNTHCKRDQYIHTADLTATYYKCRSQYVDTKETYVHSKKDLYTLEKRPMHTPKETNIYTRQTCTRYITNVGHSM